MKRLDAIDWIDHAFDATRPKFNSNSPVRSLYYMNQDPPVTRRGLGGSSVRTVVHFVDKNLRDVPVKVKARTRPALDDTVEKLRILVRLEQALANDGVPLNSVPLNPKRAEANERRNALARQGVTLPRHV